MFAGVGERTREKRLLLRDAGVQGSKRQSGRVESSDGLRPDERATGNRLRVALTGTTMAEKFRDEGRDVLLFVDNIYRHTRGN